MIKEFDHLFKIVLIGDAGVGKSSVLARFADDVFQESYLSTLGVDFKFKSLEVDKQQIKLQIWDTAGQERFRTITNVYFKYSNSIILTYDISSLQSFNNIKEFWLNQVQNHADEGVQLVLLGNKLDLEDERQVDFNIAKQFSQENEMLFFEVSAKTSQQVLDSFEKLTKQLLKIHQEKNNFHHNLNLYNDNDKDKENCINSKKGCCT